MQAIFTGTILGSLYLITGSLWLSMVMHATYDVVAVLLIYAKWEGAVAHLIVR